MFSVRDYGAVGDGTTPDDDAFAAAIAAVGTGTDWRGTTILVPRGIYRLTRPLSINRQIVLQGEGGWGGYAPTQLLFDAGVPGIVIESEATTTNGGSGAHSVVRDLAVIGANTTQTTTMPVWAHNVVTSSNLPGDQVRPFRDSAFADNAKWSVTGCYYKCVRSGTTGTTDPDQPRVAPVWQATKSYVAGMHPDLMQPSEFNGYYFRLS